jgi:hypothetical protein
MIIQQEIPSLLEFQKKFRTEKACKKHLFALALASRLSVSSLSARPSLLSSNASFIFSQWRLVNETWRLGNETIRAYVQLLMSQYVGAQRRCCSPLACYLPRVILEAGRLDASSRCWR